MDEYKQIFMLKELYNIYLDETIEDTPELKKWYLKLDSEITQYFKNQGIIVEDNGIPCFLVFSLKEHSAICEVSGVHGDGYDVLILV